jgi:xanthine dehydrogenase accessory factor
MMREVLATLERWVAEGIPAASATVAQVERSAPRGPGAMLAVNARGEVAGSVTGGCVEPAVYEEAQAVLRGEGPRVVTYGISDEEGFNVGLSCGGTVHIVIEPLEPSVVRGVSEAVREERPVAVVSTLAGPEPAPQALVGLADPEAPEEVRRALAQGENEIVTAGERRLFVSSVTPRAAMYVFGAIDFAAAVASVGRFMGYRVTVCDARATFVTPERFPDVDELVVEWPHEFLARAHVDERTAICVLTHDAKFDVPVLKAALATPAGYIGAMGSRRTNAQREERLRAEGVGDADLARIHAPIGLPIGSRSPAEVAVAIAAEIVAAKRRPAVGRQDLVKAGGSGRVG